MRGDGDCPVVEADAVSDTVGITVADHDQPAVLEPEANAIVGTIAVWRARPNRET